MLRAQRKRIRDSCAVMGGVLLVWTALGLFVVRGNLWPPTLRRAETT